jgi:hypothetical protein
MPLKLHRAGAIVKKMLRRPRYIGSSLKGQITGVIVK